MPRDLIVRSLRYGMFSTLVAATLGFSSLGCTPEPNQTAVDGWRKGAAKQWNLILVTLDTVRADRIAAYGYAAAKTPTLDRLAHEGRLYEQAFSPVPLTLPAHSSIFTGQEPPRHGVRHNGQFRLEDEAETMAERFEEAGYATAAFVSSFVLERRFGLAQGFRLYDDETETADGGEAERSAERVTDAALDWIAKRDDSANGVPFFAWVHYYDAHAPYAPPEPYASQFAGRRYDGEIAYVDAQLGRLLGAITEDDTVVLVAGDHGESLGAHLESTHSRSLYDDTQRVPLIVWSPKLLPAEISSELVGLTDLLPTIVDWFDLSNGQRSFDGQSLIEEVAPDRTLFFETLATYLDSGWAPLFAARTQREKFILAPRPEYYELERDPGELTNRYETSSRASGPLAEIRTTLAKHLAEFAPLEEVVSEIIPPDAESLERLRSLGYLGGSGPAGSGADAKSLMDPKDGLEIQARLAEAETLRRNDELEAALAIASQVQADARDDLQALQLVGILQAQLSHSVEAESSFREYLRRKDNPNVSLLLFKLLVNAGRQREALKVMESSRRSHPEHGGLIIGLADFHADAGRMREALDAYRLAKRTDPHRVGRLAESRIIEMRQRGSQ